MAAARCEIVFTGSVQGVGFRYTTIGIAKGFAVTGWVRNEPDGSVRCVAEGEPDELDRFLAAISDRMAGYIQNVRVDREAATGEFADFSIRRD